PELADRLRQPQAPEPWLPEQPRPGDDRRNRPARRRFGRTGRRGRRRTVAVGGGVDAVGHGRSSLRATIASRMSDDVSASEAAPRVGPSRRTVQRWIASGRLAGRRVGGRWRVANDAIVAFGAHEEPEQTNPLPIRTLFVANRGEIAARIRRTAARLGIATVIPRTEGPEAVDLLSIEA